MYTFSAPRGGTGAKFSQEKSVIDAGECYGAAKGGRIWSFVKAKEVLKKGNPLASDLALLSLTDKFKAAPAGSAAVEYAGTDAGDNFLEQLKAVPPVSQYRAKAILNITGGTGVDQSAIIHRIYAKKLDVEWLNTTDGRLVTALATNTDATIEVPWLVEKAGTGSAVVGFAQDDIAKDQWFWMLVEGQGYYLSGAAIAAGAALRVSASGKVDDGVITLANAPSPCGYSIGAISATDKVGWGNLVAPSRIGKVVFFHEGMYKGSHKQPVAA